MRITDLNIKIMKDNYRSDDQHIIALKKVKAIKGFYTHVLVTIFIVPFWIILNLETAPQFHWYWYAITGWILGVLIHWFGVFGFDKLGIGKDWEQNKFNELVGDDEKTMESYIQEQHYIQAKKRIKEVKGFFIHLFIELVSIAIIVFVNLKFSPGFHWFWYPIAGMTLAIFFHWLGVFGVSKFGLGKEWEERKVKELINKNNNIKG